MRRHYHHRLPFGSELLDGARTHFRIWAPDLSEIKLNLDNELPIAMQRQPDGWFECEANCGAAKTYRYDVGDGRLVPDPAARLQYGDVAGPSVVCDPHEFLWQCDDWRGRPWHEIVIYELHVGCLGGFAGVERQLPALADLGITAIELMPIADFSGKRNWGYDGVLPFAPDTTYGTPEQLKHLIDTAHSVGLCVYLDVVYNHFGPDGNFLHQYASIFFDAERHSPWGAAIDFSKPQVRDFFTQNALYWLFEFRFDGLRIDAAHQISDPGWLDEMAGIVRAHTEPDRHIHLMLENEHNQTSHLRADFHSPSNYDAQWNDDAHNVLHVLLTGETVAYYENYREQPTQKLARCLAEGFVFQGDPSPTHDGQPRGTASGDLPPTSFIFFLQNHDQIGNRAFGERLSSLCDEKRLRAAITLQLLCPQIPLLFMGEEWGSQTPFLFFTQFPSELATAVREGRRREFAAQPAFKTAARRAQIPDPNSVLTYAASIPDQQEKSLPLHQRYLTLYRQLLALRARHLMPYLHDCRSLGAEVIGDAAVLARWQLGASRELIIVVNLGDGAIPWPSLHLPATDAMAANAIAANATTPNAIPAKITALFCSSTTGHHADTSPNLIRAHTTQVFMRDRDAES